MQATRVSTFSAFIIIIIDYYLIIIIIDYYIIIIIIVFFFIADMFQKLSKIYQILSDPATKVSVIIIIIKFYNNCKYYNCSCLTILVHRQHMINS